MFYKTLSLFALSATAFAAPQENSWDSMMNEASLSGAQVTQAAAALSNPSLIASVAQIPTSAAEALVSAMPSNYVQSIANDPAAYESLVSNAESGRYPDWYTSLPSNIQSQLDAASTPSVLISATATSGQASATGSSAGSASASSTASGSGSSASASESSASESSSAAASSSTADSGAAPVQTAMAMGVAGAAGVLGLALAL